MTASSANVPIVTFGACGRSDVNSRYSMGPRTLPWGTPKLMGNEGETSSVTLVRNCRLLRYDSNSGKMADVFWILYKSPECHNLTMAWLTFSNTDVQFSLLFKALGMVWVIRWHCWIVEWARRNPKSWWGIQSLVEKWGSILRKDQFF
jgi:hypothetical protein